MPHIDTAAGPRGLAPAYESEGGCLALHPQAVVSPSHEDGDKDLLDNGSICAGLFH